MVFLRVGPLLSRYAGGSLGNRCGGRDLLGYTMVSGVLMAGIDSEGLVVRLWVWVCLCLLVLVLCADRCWSDGGRLMDVGVTYGKASLD